MTEREHTDYVVWHCTASPPSCDYHAADIKHLHTAPKDEVIQWGPYELRGKSWRDIGYARVVCRDGLVEQGRGLDEVGAHVKGFNRISVGLVMVGGVDEDGQPEDNFTDAQWTAFMIQSIDMRGRYPAATQLGHRDLSPDANGDGVIDRHDWLKACPCFDVKTKFEELGNRR